MTKQERRIFVISDIHGCAVEFNLLLEEIPLSSDTLFIFLGDYIDRGEYSRDVINKILELEETYEVIALKGNHEQMFIQFLKDSKTPIGSSFIFNGGGATLASYGDDIGNFDIPKDHLKFYDSLKLFHEMDRYLFVHAGLPDIKLSELDENKHEHDLLWIREPFLNSTIDWGKRIIHGHTPVGKIDITQNRVNIDTGCVNGGKLTALQLPEFTTYSIPKQTELEHRYLSNKRSRRKAVRFKGTLPVSIFENECLLLKNIISYEGLRTTNYSEFGLLVFDTDRKEKPTLSVGQKIAGQIGRIPFGIFEFEGIIMRRVKIHNTLFYAIQFTKTPFELLKKRGF